MTEPFTDKQSAVLAWLANENEKRYDAYVKETTRVVRPPIRKLSFVTPNVARGSVEAYTVFAHGDGTTEKVALTSISSFQIRAVQEGGGKVYQAGREHPVTDEEAAKLRAAGFQVTEKVIDAHTGQLLSQTTS